MSGRITVIPQVSEAEVERWTDDAVAAGLVERVDHDHVRFTEAARRDMLDMLDPQALADAEEDLWRQRDDPFWCEDDWKTTLHGEILIRDGARLYALDPDDEYEGYSSCADYDSETEAATAFAEWLGGWPPPGCAL